MQSTSCWVERVISFFDTRSTGTRSLTVEVPGRGGAQQVDLSWDRKIVIREAVEKNPEPKFTLCEGLSFMFMTSLLRGR